MPATALSMSCSTCSYPAQRAEMQSCSRSTQLSPGALPEQRRRGPGARHGCEPLDRNGHHRARPALPSRSVATEPASSASSASDSLMTQVNRDNVLAVRNVIKRQADDLQRLLQATLLDAQIFPCGGDPISKEATPIFNTKIRQVMKVHWTHLHELHDAVDRLDETAHSYGFTEDQVTRSFADFEAKL